jgi:arylsulfatase A-like enzyme
LDDQNDWIGCFGGNPQTKTPNLDRLGASGVVFENAYCPGAACNPSRSALFTGIPCHRSGLYSNRQQMREVLPDAQIIPHYFSRNGYWSAGSGKVLHYFIDAPSWDDYYPDKEREDPFPPWMKFGQRPKSLPRAGDWQYVETDWGAFDVSDADFQGDYLVTEWVSKQLAARHDKPFFLACGIYRPHEPWFVPKKYFDMFPLESIRMPPGLKEGDLDDVPPAGQKLGRNRYLDHIKAQGQWKQGIQGYLACVAYADAMVGRVLDALERSPYRDNTIVVLWGDNGFHLGEKEHWQKYTGWRQTARIPLIIRVPKGAPGLVDGTPAGARCSRPVNLLDLYRTLTDLCGLPEKPGTYGHSLVPLLKNPQAPWSYPSITHLDQPDSYAVSTEDWRYIHYADGGEELYDIQSDRYELRNLADRAEFAGVLQKMRGLAPENRAPLTSATLPNPALTWVPAADGPCPPSRVSTNAVMVAFTNYSGRNIRLYRIDAAGNKESFGLLAPIKTQRVQTYTGQVWLVTDEQDKALGHFVAGAESARAEIESPQL